jgi:hypothetical protein
MSFSGWLRSNSEKYLLESAMAEMARKYGRPSPPVPHGLRALFWMRVFVPVYGVLPWRVRRFTIQMMPGSHRRAWRAQVPTRRTPGI